MAFFSSMAEWLSVALLKLLDILQRNPGRVQEALAQLQKHASAEAIK